MAAVVPFLKRGIEHDERCLYVTDDNSKGDVIDALQAGGIDVTAARESGDLALYTAGETYLETGTFDRDAMLDFWRDALSEARDEYAGIRAAAEMTWALESETEHEQLAAYESLLNPLYADDDYVVLCQYNRHRFPSEMLSDVIRTHPLVVNGEAVYPNDHYIPSDEFRSTDRSSLNVDRTLKRIRDDTLVTSETASTATGDKEGGTECILLSLSDETNQRVLADWLDTQYDEVIAADTPETLTTTAVDLCVLDVTTFDRHRETLIEAKKQTEPEILPYLLVQRDESVPSDADVREHADEILTMPTDKDTLAWRIDTLLQLRGLSQRLAAKNDQIEHLANAAAHDLRNPLNVAMAWLNKIDDGEAVDKIENAHHRMEKLIENVLAVAKTGDPFSKEDREPVNLSTLVAGCWEVVPTKRAEIQMDDGLDRTLQVEPVLCRQFFENLFRNAVEHGGDSVSVRVGTIDDVGIYVEDDGPGIPADERDDVFGGGYTTGSGSGIGLTVVKRVSEYHGWNLHLSESDEGGARFEITGIDTSTTDSR